MKICRDAQVAPQREAGKITVDIGLSTLKSRGLSVEPLKLGRKPRRIINEE
ncbi:MAG TPA: hypothetical protein VED86_01260 [archaeon]|nr:hypothetical protein [archaeon]